MKEWIFGAVALTFVAGSATAQPYGWVPGSSQDTPAETGNRMAIVDLYDVSLITPEGGWEFRQGNVGADPLVPCFSPDGSIIYIIVGGDEDDNFDGNIFVYETQAVIDHFVNSGIEPTPLQTITISAPQDDAIEPVSLTITPDGSRIYMLESTEDTLYGWDVLPDGSLDDANRDEVSIPGDPSPLWVTNNGSKGYFCTQVIFEEEAARGIVAPTPTPTPGQPPLLVEVDVSVSPPVVGTGIPVPAPTQGDGVTFGSEAVQTLPFTSCAFAVSDGTPTTVVPFPGVDVADDTEVIVYSGYVGF